MDVIMEGFTIFISLIFSLESLALLGQVRISMFCKSLVCMKKPTII